MMVHLAWFGLGVLTTLTAVCLVMLEYMRRLDRPPMKTVDVDVDREVANALAAYDVMCVHHRLNRELRRTR